MSKDKKKKKKRGNGLGFIIFDLYLSLGVKHAYALLYFVALHYLLFDKKAVEVSAEYTKLRFKRAKYFTRLKHIYKIFINAGKNLIDLRLLERDFNKVHIDCDTRRIRDLVKGGNGLLILTAHIGNWQVMMRNLTELGAKVNIVMLPEENPVVREYLQIDQNNNTPETSRIENLIPRHEINIIDPYEGIEAVLTIVQELTAGNVVSIMGDRIPPGSQTLSVNFFGESMTLPEGPFRIAAVTGSPVISLLTRRNNAPSNYTMEVNEIAISESVTNKKKKIEMLAEKYAATLEAFLESSPHEWTPAGKL